ACVSDWAPSLAAAGATAERLVASATESASARGCFIGSEPRLKEPEDYRMARERDHGERHGSPGGGDSRRDNPACERVVAPPQPWSSHGRQPQIGDDRRPRLLHPRHPP